LKAASLRTYLVKSVYFNWLKIKKRAPKTEEFGDAYMRDFVESVDKMVQRQECKKLLDTVLAQLGKRCQEVLALWANKYPMKEIAETLGLAGGAKAAKKLKYECSKKLEQFLEERPNLKDRLRDCCND